SFQVTASDGEARAGVLRTAHGELRTPAFMPVGTKATVKMVDPDELRALGGEILLGNTYHLHFRPGEDVIAELGGLHRFMGRNGSGRLRALRVSCSSESRRARPTRSCGAARSRRSSSSASTGTPSAA